MTAAPQHVREAAQRLDALDLPDHIAHDVDQLVVWALATPENDHDRPEA